jgi:hypothetical protein
VFYTLNSSYKLKEAPMFNVNWLLRLCPKSVLFLSYSAMELQLQTIQNFGKEIANLNGHPKIFKPKSKPDIHVRF